MTAHADHIRGLTVFVDNTTGTEEKCIKVELCPGARVYAYEIAAKWTPGLIGDPPPTTPPAVLATLHLQDSTLELPSLGCRIASFDADLPGMAWPAFARLCAAAGSNVALVLTYGSCA
jgi:hypothetical protein